MRRRINFSDIPKGSQYKVFYRNKPSKWDTEDGVYFNSTTCEFECLYTVNNCFHTETKRKK